MFESEGGQFLRLEWRPPGAAAFDLVPPDALRTERGVTRVVSPGTKRILDGREPVRPGDGMELDAVHPAWTLERIRPEGFEPQVGGMAFLPGGDLVVSSFRPVNNGAFRDAPNGTLYVLEHATSRDPDDIVVRTLAEGFHDPLGVLVHDGDLYVCDRTAIHRLSDPDGDGSFRHREVFASGWTSDNYHHFTFGLIEHDGWLYGALSTAIYFDNTMAADHVRGTVVSMNGPNPPHRGTCFRVNLATRAIEYLCGGLRTPNGVGVGSDGEIFVTDNQGAWLPSSKLIHVRPGHFFGHANGTESSSDRYPDGGHPSLHADRPVSPPAVWFPQNEAANSPAQPLLITDGPFAGQMYVAELTMGGIRRVCLEQVGGEYQGAAFRCSQGFECGLNRMVVGPDGCLYVGGTGSDGNWSWRNRRFGLERLRPTGATAFEYDTVRATSDGFIVSFTRAVPRDWLADPSNVRVKQWTYHPTPEYGGPKYEEQTLVATDAIPAADRRSVRLVVPGLREGCVVHLRMTPTSDDGEAMWSTEAWYTLNRIPDGPRADLVEPLARPDLRAFRAETGEWAVGGDAAPWISAPSRLKRSPGTGVVVNGDAGVTKHLFTTFEHGDVEAHVEFMVPEGSNSGVYFMGRYEIQVLDSHGRDVVGFDDCGGIYQRWDPSRGR
ncbi:MAG: DUF1080 domain-containing protein, partial [Phycisphaerales bacterium]|nr:DUF1080 domain-containing protein [Phycisphaerales bacterium]